MFVAKKHISKFGKSGLYMVKVMSFVTEELRGGSNTDEEENLYLLTTPNTLNGVNFNNETNKLTTET